MRHDPTPNTRPVQLGLPDGTNIDTVAEYRPLWWHTACLSYTASGYGRRIPSPYVVRYNGRVRRVYVCCYSNVGTAYIDGPKDPDGRRPWIVVYG